MITENNTFTSNKSYLFRAILDWLLDNEATPYILVDVTKAHVEVPQEHVKDDQIVLNINPSAVQSWHVDHQAISFSARFSGSPRQIYVPMNALMAIYSQENGQGMAFPAPDTEADLIQDTGQNEDNNKVNINDKAKVRKISHLKVIK